MPLLEPAQIAGAVTTRPRRVLVAGTSGAGKTTLAARIGERLDVPHTEIDSLFHGPGWTPRETFIADVEALAASPAWVVEWQYSSVRPMLLDACDLLLWLDLPRSRVMRQVVRRTVRRRLRREELWNGNVESPLWTVFTDDEHIVRWAWSTYEKSRQNAIDAIASHPELPVVRCTTHAEASLAVRSLAQVPLRP